MGTLYTGAVTADTNVPNVTETVAATVSGVSTPRPGMRVRLRGWAQILTGAGTTAVTARIRRGVDATGVLIGEGNPEQDFAAAGSTEERNIETEESPGELAGASYVLTVQQTAATAAGTVVQAGIEAEVG